MTSERWARVKEVFNAALAQEAGRRTAFIAEATAGDEELRREVERLLDADLHAADFIEVPAAATSLSGRVVSHYEVGRLLGSGGMGRVYAARDTELGREVALKVASLDSQDAQARLRREAQHASRLSHPHICHIYEVGRSDGQPFVAMELVHGQALADVIRDGPLPSDTARRYAMEIADALAHAHERGVTHRDLKSTNVMVTTRGAKVLDFGLARILDSHEIDALSQSQRSLTGDGMIAGTLAYMAPELLRGQRGDQRADIWALGVLLYEMVSGRRPFTGATGFELSAAILHQAPDGFPPAVPASLTAIIRRCLAKDPGDRYQQAADVHRALDEMKGESAPTRWQVPRISKRLAFGTLGLAILLPAAAMVSNRIGTAVSERVPPGLADRFPPDISGCIPPIPDIPTNIFSNARGYSLLQNGEFDLAVQQFRRVAEKEPDDANAWDSLGEGYLASGMVEEAVGAYSRALAVHPTFDASVVGRGLALAALGRYDEALARESPEFSVKAFLLSRVGRYREAAEVLDQARRDYDNDADSLAATSLLSSWLLSERRQYAPALKALAAAEAAIGPTGTEPNRELMVLVDLIGGVTEVRAGNVQNAAARLEAQRSRYDRDERIESNWVAALEAEVALARGEYDRAVSSFNAAERPAWLTLNHECAVFATSPPFRDGRARVDIARGNRAGAIAEYRRLTGAASGRRSAAALEPRHVLALARLLEGTGDRAGARKEFERFVKLWANADADLPEIVEARQALARLPGP